MDHLLKALIDRHETRRIRVYFDPKKIRDFDRELAAYLKARTISHRRLVEVFVPAARAAALLGIKTTSISALVRQGKLRFPLYDYSHYACVDNYWIWVPRSEVVRYAQTRRKRSR